MISLDDRTIGEIEKELSEKIDSSYQQCFNQYQYMGELVGGLFSRIKKLEARIEQLESVTVARQ